LLNQDNIPGMGERHFLKRAVGPIKSWRTSCNMESYDAGEKRLISAGFGEKKGRRKKSARRDHAYGDWEKGSSWKEGKKRLISYSTLSS